MISGAEKRYIKDFGSTPNIPTPLFRTNKEVESLDDLKRLVENKIGKATDTEIIEAVLPAWQKLIRIIAREGSDNGKRLADNYFACLCAENIIESRFTKSCEKTVVDRSEPFQTVITHIIKVTNK